MLVLMKTEIYVSETWNIPEIQNRRVPVF